MNLFELIYEDDMFALCCLIIILGIVGENMANAKVRRWGWRAAAAAYVAFLVYAIVTLQPTTAAGLAYIAFRGLFAGGLAVGPAWMLFAMTLFFWDELPNVERRIVVPPAMPRFKQSMIDREQQRRRQDEQQRNQSRAKAECGELRLECELLYSQHREHLEGVLPLGRFKTLLDSYLSDQNDPQRVRQRTSMIKQMFTDRLAAAKSSTFKNLQELAGHFATLRHETQELPYDEDAKESILAALNKQEDESIEEFFKKGG